MNIEKEIETAVRKNGFELEWHSDELMGYAFLSGYYVIEDAPNIEQLCEDLSKINGVKYDITPGEYCWGSLEIWIDTFLIN